LAGALAIVLLTGGEDRAAAARAPGAVVRIDPDSGRVTGRHEIGGRPAAVAVGAGTVWVASALDSSLWRVEPRSGSVKRVPTGGLPRDLAYYQGRVYVSSEGPGYDGSVVAFDAVSGARQDAIERYSCSVAAGSREGLWSSECRGLQVDQLGGDPRELLVERTVTIPVRDPLTSATALECVCDLAVGNGSVWAPGDAADSRVFRIDAKRGRVLDTIEFPFAIGRGIAAGGRALWVAGLLDDVVARVDARTGRVTDRIPVGRGPVGLALSEDGLWVANQLDRTVSLVDVPRRRVVRTIDFGGAPVALAVGAGGVWAAIDG
jgi:DNA-binding beta-propeller fold protein YncE